jgi:hypothetical protein
VAESRRKDEERRSLGLLLGAIVLVILSVTLWPTATGRHNGWQWCLLCGERGSGDALLNIALFVPLAVVLTLGGRGPWATLLAAMLLSAGVELAQLASPGRYATLGDIVFNTLGAGVGILLVLSLPWWLLPPRRRAARLSLAASLLLALVVAGTGRLLEPLPPRSTYFGMWTPDLRSLQRYEGRVLRASLGDLALDPGRRTDSDSLRALVLARAPIAVEGVAGPPPTTLAPVIAVYDEHRREVLLVGAVGEDLVFRYFTRAMGLGFDQPTLRLPGAFAATAVGDPFAARVVTDGRGFCLEVNAARRCGLGYSAGDGWGLLIFAESFPLALKRFLSSAWLLALAFPLGFWGRRRRESALALAIGVGTLALLPAYVGLVPTPAAVWAGAGAGLLLGVGARAGSARLRAWCGVPATGPHRAGQAGSARRRRGFPHGTALSAAEPAPPGPGRSGVHDLR